MTSYGDLARNAAEKLKPICGDSLPAIVESQLSGSATEQYEPVTTAIALATLIVSASKAAWDIYNDVKASEKRKSGPVPETIARRLRLELSVKDHLSADVRNAVIQAVVEELPDL